jgi:hypothetical protein
MTRAGLSTSRGDRWLPLSPIRLQSFSSYGDIRYRPLRPWLSGHSSSAFITPPNANATRPSGTDSSLLLPTLHTLHEEWKQSRCSSGVLMLLARLDLNENCPLVFLSVHGYKAERPLPLSIGHSNLRPMVRLNITFYAPSATAEAAECRTVAPMEGDWQTAFTAKLFDRLCRLICARMSLVSPKYARITSHAPCRIPSRATMPSSVRFQPSSKFQ